MPSLLQVDGKVFARGRSRFLDSDGGDEPTPKIFVKVLPGNAPVPLLAQLDTGAAWSALDGEIAEALGFLEQAGPTVSLSTRSGTVRGKLIRSSLTIVADEGESCEVDASSLTLPAVRARGGGKNPLPDSIEEPHREGEPKDKYDPRCEEVVRFLCKPTCEQERAEKRTQKQPHDHDDSEDVASRASSRQRLRPRRSVG